MSADDVNLIVHLWFNTVLVYSILNRENINNSDNNNNSEYTKSIPNLKPFQFSSY